MSEFDDEVSEVVSIEQIFADAWERALRQQNKKQKPTKCPPDELHGSELDDSDI